MWKVPFISNGEIRNVSRFHRAILYRTFIEQHRETRMFRDMVWLQPRIRVPIKIVYQRCLST